MSETLEFDDLDLLDGNDLKAVFDQMSLDEVATALWGTPIGLRGRLLRKLNPQDSHKINQRITKIEHVTFGQVHDAQQQAIEIMCQLSRTGQIAFDAPEDMVA